MLIKTGINYDPIVNDIIAPNDVTSEFVAAEVTIPKLKKVNMVNFYLPPIHNSEEDEREDNFDPNAISCTNNSIIGGDLNAHHMLWDPYQREDVRGKKLEEWSVGNNLICSNDGQSTKVQSMSVPDVTFIHSSIENSKWEVLDDHHSDHRPILITIPVECTQEKRGPPTFSYKKANWPLFTAELENDLSDIETGNVKNHYEKFQKEVMKSANKHIPKGRRLNPKPWWSDDMETVYKEYKTKREVDGLDNEARKEMIEKVNEMKAESFRNFVTNLDPKDAQSKVYKFIRKIDGKGKPEHSGAPLRRGSRLLYTDEAKADGFVKEYANVSKIKVTRAETKQMKTNGKLQQNCSCIDDECSPFTLDELETAINRLKKGKAPGADEVSNEMITNLGNVAKANLLSLINECWQKKELPKEWKRATIIPILKPGKPADQISSYRPISLTSHTGKLMETMVKERLTYLLESRNLINDNQAGFRALRSTEDQCL